MNDYDLPNSVTEFIVLKNQNVAANIDGINVDLINYLGVVDVLFDVGLPSNLASAPKLNFVVQTASDAIAYADVAGASVNVTNTNTFTQLSVDTRTVNRYIRVRANVSGGNAPGWPASVSGVATLKYNPS
jgi:hypothetical protein